MDKSIVDFLDKDEAMLYALHSYMSKNGMLKQRPKFKAKNYLQCVHCNDIIHSRYEGEFRHCSCGKIAVDETEGYCRYIGEATDFIVIKEEE